MLESWPLHLLNMVMIALLSVPFGLITGRLIEQFRLDNILQKNQPPGCY